MEEGRGFQGDRRMGLVALIGGVEGRMLLLGVGRAPDWTRQTCRARYQGPDLPKLTWVPPNPAWESS